MASTINAISTGAGGLATSADASGILQIQTNGTTAITVNASQVVSLTNALPITSGGTGLTSPGTSGNILTSNGTAWTSSTPVPTTGSGGTTITGSVTLTSSSAASMTVIPTTPGLYVTLPSATTCSKGGILFSIFNNGDYDYGIKNSAGTQLGWVLPRTNSIVGLSDNSTAIGIWNISNLCKIGVTAKKDFSTRFNSKQSTVLDSNRILMTVFDTTSNLLYGVVYDASTFTWGSLTLIRSPIVGFVESLLIATNTVLVVSNGNSSYATGTAMETVVLSISGTTITVNTAVATTLAGNFAFSAPLVAVGTSYIFAYSRATSVTGLRAITVSGTVPTVGAEVINSQNDATATMQLYVSGSVVRLITQITSQVQCNPYTVSGATLTAGTATATASTATGFRCFQNAAGNIIVLFINTTLFAAIFKLTGTTEAVTAISVGSSTPAGAYGTYWDIAYISATQTGVVWVSTGNTSYNANILTDTTGTVSVGTQVTGTCTGTYSGTISSVSTLNVTTANMMKVWLSNYSGGHSIALFDCSGTSPTLSSLTAVMPVNNASTSVSNFSKPGFDDTIIKGTITKRSVRALVIGDTTIYAGAYQYNTDSVISQNRVLLNFIPNYSLNTSSTSFAGINTNQSVATINSGFNSAISIVDGAAV